MEEDEEEEEEIETLSAALAPLPDTRGDAPLLHPPLTLPPLLWPAPRGLAVRIPPVALEVGVVTGLDVRRGPADEGRTGWLGDTPLAAKRGADPWLVLLAERWEGEEVTPLGGRVV